MYHTWVPWMVWTGTVMETHPIGQLGKPLEIQPRWASKHGPTKITVFNFRTAQRHQLHHFWSAKKREVGWFKLQSMFASCKPAPPPPVHIHVYICIYIFLYRFIWSYRVSELSHKFFGLPYIVIYEALVLDWFIPPTLESPKSYPQFGVSERYKRLNQPHVTFM